MSEPNRSESNYIDELQSQFDKMRKYLDLVCKIGFELAARLEKARKDTKRMDWLENVGHPNDFPFCIGTYDPERDSDLPPGQLPGWALRYKVSHQYQHTSGMV